MLPDCCGSAVPVLGSAVNRCPKAANDVPGTRCSCSIVSGPKHRCLPKHDRLKECRSAVRSFTRLSSVRAAMKVAVLLLIAAFVSCVAGDVCTFTTTSTANLPLWVTGSSYFTTSVANVRGCLTQIAYNSAQASQVINAVNVSANLYSFTDIAASSSGLDYNLNVRYL